MELKDFIAHRDAIEETLDAVVAKIRPLPADIAPSEGFRRRMRLQLLQLESGAKRSAQQAA